MLSAPASILCTSVITLRPGKDALASDTPTTPTSGLFALRELGVLWQLWVWAVLSLWPRSAYASSREPRERDRAGNDRSVPDERELLRARSAAPAAPLTGCSAHRPVPQARGAGA